MSFQLHIIKVTHAQLCTLNTRTHTPAFYILRCTAHTTTSLKIQIKINKNKNNDNN